MDYWFPRTGRLEEKGESLLMGVRFFFEVMRNVLKLIVVMATQLCEYT